MNETVIAFLKVSHHLVPTGMHLFLQVKCSSVSLFLRQLSRSFIVENACSHSYCEEATLPVLLFATKLTAERKKEENIYFSYSLYSFFIRQIRNNVTWAGQNIGGRIWPVGRSLLITGLVDVVDLGFTTLLTSESEKFCSEALISASGSFTCQKSITRDPWLYFPSEGSHTQNFYALKKIHRPRPGLNPRTLDPVASMVTMGPPGYNNSLINNICEAYHHVAPSSSFPI